MTPTASAVTLATGAARQVARARSLSGRLTLPADKSIAHRALIFNAVASSTAGPACVRLWRPGDDVRSTLRCLRALGTRIEERERGDTLELEIHRARLTPPDDELDCGNSGTTMRLLAGALAGRDVTATLDGDASLRRRPMERVAGPLRDMGADVSTSRGRPPIRVRGRRSLRALEHRLPVASAQVVGAICLAAASAQGTTRIVSPAATRDHTERLLAAMGARVNRTEDGRVTTLVGPADLRPLSFDVPGDPSAAAAWLVAAAVHPDADVELVDVGLNPTRLAVVDVLREMGAHIVVTQHPDAGPEPVGTLRVTSSGPLRPVSLDGARIAALIDELPLLAVAMAAIDGESEVRDAGELRIKESDRIAATVAGLAAIGARVDELRGGWRVARGRPRDAAIATHGDHRLAIAFAVAAAAGVAGTVTIDDAQCASVSYPGFWNDLATLS